MREFVTFTPGGGVVAYGDVPVRRNERLSTHNVNVRIPDSDLLEYRELSDLAGLSLNKWILRACRRKAEQELLLLAELRQYEEGGLGAG